MGFGFKSLAAMLLRTTFAVGAGRVASGEFSETLLESGHVDDAQSLLNQRLAASQDDAQAYHLLSRTYFAVGKWDQAIKNAEKAVSLDPSNSTYHLWLGRAYGRKAETCSWFCAAGLAGK